MPSKCVLFSHAVNPIDQRNWAIRKKKNHGETEMDVNAITTEWLHYFTLLNLDDYSKVRNARGLRCTDHFGDLWMKARADVIIIELSSYFLDELFFG